MMGHAMHVLNVVQYYILTIKQCFNLSFSLSDCSLRWHCELLVAACSAPLRPHESYNLTLSQH